MKFGLEVLSVKASFFLLEFIDETVKKFFVYKCKLSLSLLLPHLVDLFTNKLKTKFFFQNDFKNKKNSQLFFFSFLLWHMFNVKHALKSLVT